MPFIFGWIPLRCGFNLTLGKWTMFLRSILVSLCITAQVRVYLVTRKYLRQAEVQPLSIPMQQTGFVLKHRDDLQRPPSTTAAESSSSLSVVNMNKNAPFFVHRRNKTVSKLELEASLTLVVGVLSLCVITSKFLKFIPTCFCFRNGNEMYENDSSDVYPVRCPFRLPASGR